jgi:O-antigen ligase
MSAGGGESPAARPAVRSGLHAAATLCATVGLCGLLLVLPTGRPLQPWIAWPLVGATAAGILAARAAGVRFRGLPFLAIFAAATAASVWWSPLRETSLARVGPGFVLMLLHPAAQVVGSSRRGRMALALTALAVVATTALDLLSQRFVGTSLLLGIPRPAGQRRLAGSLPNPNEAAFVAVLAPLACAVFVGAVLRGQAMLWRWFATASAAVVFAASLVTAWLTGSRAILMGLFLAAFTVLAACRRRWAAALVAVAMAGVGVAWIADLGSIRVRIAETLRIGDDPRMRTWAIALDAFEERPWIGQGPCVFFEINEATRAGARERGWETPVGGMPWAHSIPIELLCERGLLGLAAAGLVVASAVAGLARGWRARQERLWTLGVAGALASLLAMSLVDLSFLKDWCSILVWTVIGLACGAGDADRPASRGEG